MAYDETTASQFMFAQNALNLASSSANRINGSNGSSGSAGWPFDPIVTAGQASQSFNHEVTKPAITPPPSFTDVLQEVDTAPAETARLNALAEDWLNSYFPAINAGLRTIPEDWLVGVIGGTRPFGLNQTVFELVWHAARDRAARTRRGETAQTAATFSASGFSLPPGAMAAMLDAAMQRESETVLEVSREQAIKDADIKLDLLKFAEGQALSYKTALLNTLADFYRQWSSAGNNDLERARIRAQAMSSLYGALGAYHNVELAFEELRLKAATSKTEFRIQDDRTKIMDKDKSGKDSANTAHASAANAFASVAASAVNAASTLAARIATGDME